MRVCKFGGAPLADGAAIRKMEQILKREPERRVLVPSAPGKRDGRDEKITDLLYACQAAAAAGRNFGHLFDRVAERYREIAHSLGLPPPDSDLRAVYAGLKDGRDAAWAASRGEWLCGRLLARYLDWPFVDAAEVIRFDTAGRLKFQETMELLRHRLRGGGVLPGFYGAEENGAIHTFARGGSDIAGALAAAALNADVYENFKDVAGVFAADPAIVPGARCVADMTYRELRVLSRLGAQVISEAAVAPVRAAGIPLNIRPAADPAHPGTWIHAAFGGEAPRVTGITGRRGLTLWRLEAIEKGADMARAALDAALPLERLAVDADTLCLTLRGKGDLPETLTALAHQARHQERLATLSLVGEALPRLDAPARFSAALTAAGIRPLSLHLPPAGQALTAVVPEADYEAGIRAVYDAFFRE